MHSFPPPPRTLRPVRGFATAAVVTLGVAALADTVWTLGGPGLEVLLLRASEDGFLTGWDDLPVVVLLLLRPFAYLVGGTAFLAWLFRARANAETLSQARHRWFRVLIVLGWFLPVVNWWIPKQIVDDVWVSSRPGGVRGEHIGGETHSWLVWAWWVSWLLGIWVLPPLSGALMAMRGRALSRGTLGFELCVLAPTLLAAVLAILVVLRITGYQEGRRAWVDAGPPL